LYCSDYDGSFQSDDNFGGYGVKFVENVLTFVEIVLNIVEDMVKSVDNMLKNILKIV
jgi:hypothetical protein